MNSNPSNPSLGRRMFRLLLPVLLPLLPCCGCATKALWSPGQMDSFNEPAPNPRVRLFRADRDRDVLVVYDEIRERNDRIAPRAYLLYQNMERLERGRHPRFVAPSRASGLPAVPVTPAESPAPAGLSAVLATNGLSFTIRSDGKVISHHDLPIYDDRTARVKRLVLTPLTVIADLTVVGGVLFLMAWSHGGFPVD